MKRLALILILAILVLPQRAFAHGEEVLVSLFLELLTIVILGVTTFRVNLTIIGKLLFALIWIASIVLSVVAVDVAGMHIYEAMVDIIIVGVPLIVAYFSLVMLKRRFSKKGHPRT